MRTPIPVGFCMDAIRLRSAVVSCSCNPISGLIARGIVLAFVRAAEYHLVVSLRSFVDAYSPFGRFLRLDWISIGVGAASYRLLLRVNASPSHGVSGFPPYSPKTQSTIAPVD